MADESERDYGAELDEVKEALQALAKAKTPAAKREARRDVEEAKDDLEETLRKAGYRVSRDDLDALVEQREDERIQAKVDAYLEKIAADDDGEEEDGDGKKKPAAKKPAAKKPAAKEGSEEEEWA